MLLTEHLMINKCIDIFIKVHASSLCLWYRQCSVTRHLCAGIREGGRTGLTALTTGFCFFVALFFAPLLGDPLSPFSSRQITLSFTLLSIRTADACNT